MSSVAGTRLESISLRSDGYALVVSSNLGGNYWDGYLSLIPPDFNFHDALYKSHVAKEMIAGCADGCWINDSLIAIGTDEGNVEMLKQDDMFYVDAGRLSSHNSFVTSISVSSDSSLVLSGSADSTINVSDVSEVHLVQKYEDYHLQTVNQVCFHNSEPKLFASCSQDGIARIWDTRKATTATRIAIDDRCVPTSIAYLSSLVLLGYIDGRVDVMDVRDSGNPLKTFSDVHKSGVRRILPNPHKLDRVATAGEDRRVNIFTLNHYDILYRNEEHLDFVTGLAWINSDSMYSCSWDSKVLTHKLPKLVS